MGESTIANGTMLMRITTLAQADCPTNQTNSDESNPIDIRSHWCAGAMSASGFAGCDSV
jgi:hypothetical protein